MTGRAPFTYVDNAQARTATAALATAFFSATLLGDQTGSAYLDAGRFGPATTLSKR